MAGDVMTKPGAMRLERGIAEVPQGIGRIKTEADLARFVREELRKPGSVDLNAVIGLPSRLGPNSITAEMLAPDSVGSSEIAPDAVGTSELGPEAVTNAEVATAAGILGSKLATTGGRLAQTAQFVGGASSFSLTTSYQDIPGTTHQFTPSVTCRALVVGTAELDIHANSGLSNRGDFILNVDGVDADLQGSVFLANASASNIESAVTACQVWEIGGLTAALHTFKLRAKKTSGSLTGNCNSGRYIYWLLAP